MSSNEQTMTYKTVSLSRTLEEHRYHNTIGYKKSIPQLGEFSKKAISPDWG